MPESRKSTILDLEDEAPDLSAPEWRVKLEKSSVRRGRPLSAKPKVLTTLRLDADVLEAFRAQGAGWQTRINDGLKAILSARDAKQAPKGPPSKSPGPARKISRAK